jgi:putative flippase GtrA
MNSIPSGTVDVNAVTGKTYPGWLKSQILRNSRFIKYGLVGCIGIVANLATMALFVTLSSQRGWVPSAIANIVSTVGNFILHNVWTFSDRAHRGIHMVRGFIYFAIMSAAGIGISTLSYVGFTRLATHLTLTKSHAGSLGVVLACQFVAILIGASVGYLLNREFTWPHTDENAPSSNTHTQKI